MKYGKIIISGKTNVRPMVLHVPNKTQKDLNRIQSLHFFRKDLFGENLKNNVATLNFNLQMVRDSIRKPQEYDLATTGWMGRKTRKGFYFNSDIKTLDKAFSRIGLNGKTFMDLGYGMGDVVALAAIHGAAGSFGIEDDPWMIKASKIIADKLKDLMPEIYACRLLSGDFRKDLNFSEYDVYYSYPDHCNEVEFFGYKFARYARAGAIFILNAGHNFGDTYKKYLENMTDQFRDLNLFVYRRNNIPFK